MATVAHEGPLNATMLGDLAATLAGEGLPTSDLAREGRWFWRFHDAIGTVGFGGVEGDGSDRLLRSVIVMPARRGGGHGSSIVAAVESIAAERGARRLHLLTTGARMFFQSLGYVVTDRNSAPATIAGSEQFATLCPGSATYMTKDIVTP